jgi:hypothetical protein
MAGGNVEEKHKLDKIIDEEMKSKSRQLRLAS